MLSLFLNPAVLCLLVWLVARGSTDLEFGKMFFIALAVSIVGAVLNAAVGESFLALFALIPLMVLLAYLLMKYSSLTLQQALIVTGSYFAWQVGLVILLATLLH